MLITDDSRVHTIPFPQSVTVQIDTREQYPILFPSNIYLENPEKDNQTSLIAVTVEHTALKTGDYRLREYPDVCVIERKASQQELIKNLFNAKDYVRQTAAFHRLSTCCTHPVLLLETTPLELASSKFISNSDQLINRLIRCTNYYGFEILFAGRSTSASGRRALGGMLLHMMLGYSLYPSSTIRGSRLGEGSGSPAPSLLIPESREAS